MSGMRMVHGLPQQPPYLGAVNGNTGAYMVTKPLRSSPERAKQGVLRDAAFLRFDRAAPPVLWARRKSGAAITLL
ncbi:hypothetical protein ACTTAL_16040 [Rhodobacter capsulatus]|uniref:hypothetical protein n=1 Tax=Rhodobacter capsulatus TaxID=1061 RepID=UPI0012FECD73|nr:hypothetical protein [Rhodobacter capsulatus]